MPAVVLMLPLLLLKFKNMQSGEIVGDYRFHFGLQNALRYLPTMRHAQMLSFTGAYRATFS